MEVRFNSSCINNNWKETSTCDGLHPGSEVGFIATIKVIVVFTFFLARELRLSLFNSEFNLSREINVNASFN